MEIKQHNIPTSKSIIISAGRQSVWSVISKRGNLELCHPFCESNPVEKWGDRNSIDYVNYYNGLKFKRTFIDWIDGMGYDLLIGKQDRNKSKVIWRIIDIDKKSCELSISIFPRDIGKYPRSVKYLVYALYINPMLRKYLSYVLKGFKYYSETGNAVQKNQFGKHKWFTI